MNKTVLVTGASGGIGSACARLFADKGYKVAVHCRKNKAAAEELTNELRSKGCEAVCVCADLSDDAQVKAMFSEIRNTLGDVEILINNAGVAQQKLFTDTTRADYDFLFGANLLSAINCSREALKSMIAAHSGSIVNVSSMWGISGASCEVLYSASKAALIGFTKALAKEAGPSNIRVNCVAPGVVDTKMNSNLSQEDMQALADETPLCRIGKPEEIANAVVFLATQDASFVTGQILSVDGGFIV
ncbi:MAG: SDR family oxidoreductase [Clostridia bacterium]|nr:SDR family oxidoreductase [Clostridia bacterium]